MRKPYVLLAAVVLAGVGLTAGRAEDIDKRVLDAEAKRIAAIDKVRMSVLAIFAPGFTNGGSGVVISDDGYALTNFHVVMAPGTVMPTMKCGLADGKLYDAVLVGTDKVGDIALIKLLPKKEGDKFKFAALGDSDKTRAGDWSLAMGNPFLLATDFTPTVTFGMVSGVHRYEPSSQGGAILEYTDCLQIDTSINPGNSGGPLFNMDGELIGINGKGSFEKRVRINSGVGYAISINQIKNFLGQLKAGLEPDHASLGALVESESEEGPVNKMVVVRTIPSDATRRGLDVGDQPLFFAGRPLTSANNLKNVLGIYPRGWRLPMTFRRESEKREILVRLMGSIKEELETKQPDDPKQPKPPTPPAPKPSGPAAKFYEAKPGFANYYFNKQERDKLLTAFATQYGDFSKLKDDDWTWTLKGTVRGRKNTTSTVEIQDKAGAKKGAYIKAKIDGIDDELDVLKPENKPENYAIPQGSGGLLTALYMYRQVLSAGTANVPADISHGGVEPFYPPSADGGKPDFNKSRVDCEVLRSKFAGFTGKWYYSPKDHVLLGGEVTLDRDEDPCELYFSNYKDVDGRKLPGRVECRYGDKVVAVWDDVTYTFAAPK